MKIFRALLPLAVGFSLFGFSTAQDVKYEKYRLDNGMTVIFHEDHSLPVATVNIWYHVGSKDEPPGRSGFAHLFEHLMFMGTERAPTGAFDQIMEGGGGNNNASTDTDRTNYFDFGPSALLPTLLWLEADRMEDLGRMMDQKKLDLQREVVKNERRENFENAAYGMAYLKISEALYPEGHPYRIDTIGLPEDLDAATVKDVKDFFAKFYVPNNATMVVAGDFDPKEIRPMIARLFGTLPRQNDPIHKNAQPPKLTEAKRLTIVDDVPQGRTYMAWVSPAYYQPGDGEMDLAAGVLAGDFNSRLYQRLVVKDQLASDVSAFQASAYLNSVFYIVATAREGVSLDQVEKEIDEEVARFVKSGPTSEELSRQKAQYEYSALRSLQDLGQVADRLNQYDFYLNEPNSFKWDVERRTSRTPAEVQNWAGKVLDPNARIVLRVVPTEEAPAQNPRNEKPAILADKPFSLPVPQELTLGNGVKLYYFERPDLPLMSLSALFRAGSASDPAGKSGLASMAAEMLTQGAGDLDAAELNKQLDELGAQFSASADLLTTEVNLSVTTANFTKALDLFANSLIRYRVDDDAWKREQQLRIDSLNQDADDPSTVARVVSLREFFGANHPYGRNPSGSPETVDKITRQDVLNEHQALFQAKQMTFFAAGSMKAADLKKLLDERFNAWQPSGAALSNPTLPAPANKGLRVVIVDKPQAVQTVIRFVFPGVAYSDPSRLAREGLSTVLGGTFTSRLNANLREDKGYTYGAGSRAIFDPGLGYLIASSAVKAEVTGASLKEFLKEFDKLRGGDVTDAEAVKARASMRTDFISSMGSLDGLIAVAENLFVNGQNMNDLSKDLVSISKMNAAQVNPIAAQVLSMDKAVLVLVGDKDLILKQIADLKLPAPQVVPGIDG